LGASPVGRQSEDDPAGHTSLAARPASSAVRLMSDDDGRPLKLRRSASGGASRATVGLPASPRASRRRVSSCASSSAAASSVRQAMQVWRTGECGLPASGLCFDPAGCGLVRAGCRPSTSAVGSECPRRCSGPVSDSSSSWQPCLETSRISCSWIAHTSTAALAAMALPAGTCSCEMRCGVSTANSSPAPRLASPAAC